MTAMTRAVATSPIRQTDASPGRDLLLRTVFEGAAVGMALCSLDGCILEINPALAKTLGRRPEDVMGTSPWASEPGDAPAHAFPIHELICGERGSLSIEKHYPGKDGADRWGHWTVSLVRNAAGDPAFLFATMEDTTERRREAEQLREAEKMEVIGRLAGGIAHDFNNLLTGILLYCDLLTAGLPRSTGLRKYVDEVRMAGEQGAALTQQLLAVARKQVLEPRSILLADVVSSTENLLRRLIGEQIELVTLHDPEVGAVLGDQAQLRQVLLNLVLNARDAIPHGGRITVRTRSRVFAGSSQQWVSLLVEDDGCGMNEETRGRLFEPFFTTKKAGHGTGLGLSTVQRIVGESGGTIQVESEPGPRNSH